MTSDLLYCQTLTASPSRILQSSSNITVNASNNTLNYSEVEFYFLPVDDRETDSSWKSVFDISNNSASFIQGVNGNLTGLPKLMNLSYASAIDYVTEQQFSSLSAINLTYGETWVASSGILLKSNGYLFLQIYQGVLENDTTASYQQIVNNKISTGGLALETKRGKFSINQGSVSYNFSNLSPNTSYIIAYFGTNDNPSYQDSLKTEIRKANVTTAQKASFSSRIVCSVLWIVVMIVIVGV